MANAGTNVIINVSSRSLNLINVDNGEIIASHQMPRISFASGGDTVSNAMLKLKATKKSRVMSGIHIGKIQSNNIVF